MSEEQAPKLIQIICTAASDCFAQNNQMAALELLDAAAMAGDLLAVAQKIKAHGTLSSTWYDELEAAINKATGAQS